MKTIFIVGNGFDLAHGLKTSYVDFIEDWNHTSPSNSNFHYLLNDNIKENNKWSDIEHFYFTLLNNYDDSDFFNENFGFLSYDSSSELNKEFEAVKLKLEEYLLEEQKKFAPIEVYKDLFEKLNDEESLILNFNYTNTVKQYLNNIANNQIQHIYFHGELENENNPIIFGYAATDQESKLLINKNDNELMKNIKRINYLRNGFDRKLNEILDSTRCDIDIYILGHSCGISDRLILSQLFNHKNVRNITSFYYDNFENYRSLAINIDRIIDDYSKKDEASKSLNKLNSFDKSIKMPQQNSGKYDIEIFKNDIEKIRTRHALKHSQEEMISAAFPM